MADSQRLSATEPETQASQLNPSVELPSPAKFDLFRECGFCKKRAICTLRCAGNCGKTACETVCLTGSRGFVCYDCERVFCSECSPENIVVGLQSCFCKRCSDGNPTTPENKTPVATKPPPAPVKSTPWVPRALKHPPRKLNFDDPSLQEDPPRPSSQSSTGGFSQMTSDQLHEMHTKLSKDVKELENLDRERARREDIHDQDPPLTQAYYALAENGPTRLDRGARFRFEVEGEAWIIDHNDPERRKDLCYRGPSKGLHKKHHVAEDEEYRLPDCVLCHKFQAMTVTNCGHAIYCIKCAATKPMFCHACDANLFHITPIMNLQFGDKRKRARTEDSEEEKKN